MSHVNKNYRNLARESAIDLRKRLGFSSAYYGLILESGWGEVMPFNESGRISLKKITNIGNQVSGLEDCHRDYVVGKYKKRKNIIALDGRYYNNDGPGTRTSLRLQTEIMCHLGIKKLIVIAAVSTLRPGIQTGSIVIINDLISQFGIDPLADDESVALDNALDPKLNNKVFYLAQKYYPKIAYRGTHIMVKNAGRVTVQDRAMFKTLGSVIGRNVLPEVAIASLYGIETVALGVVTESPREIPDVSALKKFISIVIKKI